MTAELSDKASVNLYGGINHDLISTVEVTDKTAIQLYSIARNILFDELRADYAKIEFRGRTMTIT